MSIIWLKMQCFIYKYTNEMSCDTSIVSKNENFESYRLNICMVYTPFTLLQGKRLQFAMTFQRKIIMILNMSYTLIIYMNNHDLKF